MRLLIKCIFCAFFILMFGADSVVQVANLNWRTADLSNAAFLARNCEDNGISECAVSVAPGEYTTSSSAIQGLMDRDVDFFLECWSNCSGHADLVAEPTQLTGIYGLYAPTWLLEAEPSLRNIESWHDAVALQGTGSRRHVVIRGHEVDVFGTVDTWTADIERLHSFYGSNGLDALNESVRNFVSESEMDSAILACLRDQTPVVFMYWEPSIMAAGQLYRVERLEVPTSFRDLFPIVEIQKVRRSDHAPAKHLFRFESFSMPDQAMKSLLQSFASVASSALPSTDSTYARAIRQVATSHECKSTGRRCNGKVLGTWPRDLDPALPSKVVVWVKNCQGFIDVLNTALLDASGECKMDAPENLRNQGLLPGQDIEGYTVRHIIRTLELIGYSESDVTFRCIGTTNQLVQYTAMDLAHIGAACITLTSERMALVDFTPYYATGYGFIVKTEDSLNAFNFADPFAEDLWLGLLFIAIFVGLTIYWLEYPMHITNAFLPKDKQKADSHNKTLSIIDPILNLVNNFRGRPSFCEVGDFVNARDEVGRSVSGRVVKRSRTSALSDDIAEVEVGDRQIVSRVSLKKRWRTEHIADRICTTQARAGILMMGRDGEIRNLQNPASRFAANLTVCFGSVAMALYTANLAAYMVVKSGGVITALGQLQGSDVGVGSARCGGCSPPCKVDRHTQSDRHAVELFVDEVLNSGPRSLQLQRFCVAPSDRIRWLVDQTASMCAVVGDEPPMKRLAKEYNDEVKACKLTTLSSGSQDMGYAFPKGSPLRQPVTEAVTHLNTRLGIREELDPIFFPTSTYCDQSDSAESLTVFSTSGLLVIYCALMMLVILRSIICCCLSQLEENRESQESEKHLPETSEGPIQTNAEDNNESNANVTDI